MKKLFNQLKNKFFGIKFKISCDKDDFKKLEDLRVDLDCKSHSETLQRALTLLSLALQEKNENGVVNINGTDINIIDKNSETNEGQV